MSTTTVTSSPAVVTAPSAPKPGGGGKNGDDDDILSSSTSSSSSLFPVLRVSQLDAHALDDELVESILLKQLQKCFDCVNDRVGAHYKEEMKLFL